MSNDTEKGVGCQERNHGKSWKIMEGLAIFIFNKGIQFVINLHS